MEINIERRRDKNTLVNLKIEKVNKYLQRAHYISRIPTAKVAPNPRVGCVLVENDRIISEGLHWQAGLAHAEVNAFDKIADQSKLHIEAHVSLEPCSHQGKTPPCAHRIVQENISTVRYSMLDPNPVVAGNGIEYLQENEICTIEERLPEIPLSLLPFLVYHRLKRPYVCIKYAQSADGFIGKEGKQIAISNPTSSRFVHKLRADHQAIMVGTNTLLTDQAQLTNRHYFGHQPTIIILDQHARIDKKIKTFDSENTKILISSVKNHPAKVHLSSTDTFIFLPKEEWNSKRILTHLYERKIQSILIEGGAKLINNFIDLNLWDTLYQLTGDISLGSGIPAPTFHAKEIGSMHIKDNRMSLYRNVKNKLN